MEKPKIRELEEVRDPDTQKKRPKRRRMKARYWRQIPTGRMDEATGRPELTWVQTLPIPSDPESRQIYEAKGYSLAPPEVILAEMQRKDGVECPYALCHYVATGKGKDGEAVDMAMQLAMHIRSAHQDKKSANQKESEQPASSSADTPEK